MKKAIIGNWKMNGASADFAEIEKLSHLAKAYPMLDVAVCVPDLLLARWVGQTSLPLGGQNCHAQLKGAFTGDTSGALLKEIGASYVIVGHSERRLYQGETNADVRQKAETAIGQGLQVIICIGETEAEYREGNRLEVVQKQLLESLPNSATYDNCLIAYEPVWAIGTGLVPIVAEISQMHSMINAQLLDKKMRLLYGGSVNGKNADEIVKADHVSGVLVGGASLTADAFAPIVHAFSVC